jgi:alpha-beta hydrolase superfamily lysophospholipase
MTPQVRRIETSDGYQLAVDWYTAPSSRRAVLFVHGLGSHRRGEKARYFAGRFNARGWSYASLDLRGHGDSDGCMADLTMSGLLKDVSAATGWLREQVPGDDMVLIGSSLGAAVIAWHRLANEPRTAPLVMIGPSLNFPSSVVAALTPEDLADWRRTGTRRFESQWIDVEIGYGLVEDAAGYDPNELARRHGAPTLILHGMRDTAIDWTASVRFARDSAVPVDLFLVGDGDHRLTDHKELVFEVLWDWLAIRDRSTAGSGAPP